MREVESIFYLRVWAVALSVPTAITTATDWLSSSGGDRIVVVPPRNAAGEQEFRRLGAEGAIRVATRRQLRREVIEDASIAIFWPDRDDLAWASELRSSGASLRLAIVEWSRPSWHGYWLRAHRATSLIDDAPVQKADRPLLPSEQSSQLATKLSELRAQRGRGDVSDIAATLRDFANAGAPVSPDRLWAIALAEGLGSSTAETLRRRADRERRRFSSNGVHRAAGTSGIDAGVHRLSGGARRGV